MGISDWDLKKLDEGFIPQAVVEQGKERNAGEQTAGGWSCGPSCKVHGEKGRDMDMIKHPDTNTVIKHMYWALEANEEMSNQELVKQVEDHFRVEGINYSACAEDARELAERKPFAGLSEHELNEAMAEVPPHLTFADLTDEEIEEGLTALHQVTELDMEGIEAELRAANSEYRHYRDKQLREGFNRLKQIEELQELLAAESRKVRDAVKQVEASIEFFENQCRMGEGLKAGEYERQQFRAYRIAHQAAVEALRAVKRELTRTEIK